MIALRVLAVASEVFPLIKTGGLADVTGALPAALAREKIAVRTLVPGYPAVIGGLGRTRVVMRRDDVFSGPARVLAGRAGDLDLLVLDAPHLFDRPGNPYVGPDGNDWPDNAERFSALCQTAASIGIGAIKGYQPAVIHAHDWQAGLAPAYARLEGGPASVMTVHNLAFHGRAPASMMGRLGLPPEMFGVDGVEFHGAISALKAGLHYADRITTVSPGYAAEIQTPAFGWGFEGLLRHRAGVLSGILNGIDTTVWNPAADPAIKAGYDVTSLDRRAANTVALRERMGLLPDPIAPLFGVISRLTDQKGMDLLLACLPGMLADGGQLAVLGSGDPALEAGFRRAAREAAGRVGVVIGYDEALAHQMQAGIDALLVPSRFEPCGLTQLCALRYGAVPVVSRVGGLADTVIDANAAALGAGVATGVQFAPSSVDGLAEGMRRAGTLFRDRGAWRRLMGNGMAADVSWTAPARQYAMLFRHLVETRAA